MATNRQPGFFLTFEGGEGSGKSTQIKWLHRFLTHLRYPVTVTREPGGSPIAETIRPLFLNADLSSLTRFFLVWAARFDHIQKVIEPALERGDWLICDRFYDSTWAYQGYGDQIDLGLIQTIQVSCLNRQPDLTIFLDLPPRVALERAFHRHEKSTQTLFERLPLDYHERVYQGFQMRCLEDPNRIIAISADGSIEEVHRQIIETLKKREVLPHSAPHSLTEYQSCERLS